MSILDRYDVATLREAIQSASPDQLPALLDLLNAELAGLDDETIETMRRSPAAMAAYVTRGRYRLYRYTKLLSQKFADAVSGKSKRQIWNLPARYGKSLMASRWGPIWTFDQRPEARIILTSYGATLAFENAIFVRDTLITNPHIFRTTLKRDRRARDRFLTEQGGGILAAGIGGAITGFGAGEGGGIVMDDPFKNWQEAHSETERERVWNEYLSVLRLRLDDESAWIILVMTRWHEDDIAGRLMERDPEDWEVIRLPAIAEPFDPNSNDPFLRVRDPLGRKPGEALEPERFSLKEVQARAASLGSYLAAGLEQQRPAPAEGGEIKRAWWKWSSSLPSQADAWISSWDTKLKEKESGDFQVGQIWSRTGTDFWCHDQLRGQWTMLGMACAIALLAVRFPQVRRHYVENTGNGPEVMDILRKADPTFEVSAEIAGALGMSKTERAEVQALLRKGLPGVLPVNPKGSKVARARAVSAFIEAGNTHLPEGKDWALSLVNECSAFPNGTYDDQVDAMSQGLAVLSGKIRARVGPSGGEQDSHWKGGG